MAYKTFKYRLYPSKAQAKNLVLILEVVRQFYNMMLDMRKVAWEQAQQKVTKNAQLKLVKQYKATFPQAQQVHSHVLQQAVADLEGAFQAFFRRVKAKEKAGYPRFKGATRFHSFGFKEYGNGFKIDGRRLRVFGAGRIPVRWHRPLEGKVKTCRISWKAGQWWVSFTCEVEAKKPLPPVKRAIGLDMGITALITTDQGEKIENPKYYRKAQRELRVIQCSFARKQPDSTHRQKGLIQLQRFQQHVANQRADFLHKLTFELTRYYDWIAVENLQINNMVKNHHLSKSILDSGWGLFVKLLTGKAADAGRELHFVDPYGTSKTCSTCGATFEGLILTHRWVECACGLSLDRDHNAAINVLMRSGWDAPVSPNVDH